MCGRSQAAHKKQQQHKTKTCLTKKGERVDATFERSACCAILPRIVNHFTHFHARTSTHTHRYTYIGTQGLADRIGFIIYELALIDLIITIHPENDWPRSAKKYSEESWIDRECVSQTNFKCYSLVSISWSSTGMIHYRIDVSASIAAAYFLSD